MMPRPLEPHGDLIIAVRGLAREGAFQDVSFDVHRGEVLGFAGLIGAGRTDVGLALRDRAGDRRHHRARRQAGDDPLAQSGDGARHRLSLGRPAPAWPVAAHGHFGQHLAAGAATVSQQARPRAHSRGANDRRALSPAPGDTRAVGRPCRQQTLRRQPAEGHAGQVAEYPSLAADPGRADARRRRRRQGGGPCHDRRARRRGHRHHADSRPARGADAQRSRPGHARRATDGDLQP